MEDHKSLAVLRGFFDGFGAPAFGGAANVGDWGI
jgi:hypothetical protein